MRRIRVVHVIDRLNVGGPALLAQVLSERLDPERFDHWLLAGSVDADEADFAQLRAPRMRVERIAGLGRSPLPWDDAAALARITSTLRRLEPDIVHSHKAKAGVLGRLAAWMTGVPATVHTYHGHLLHGYFSPLATRAVVDTERVFARFTTRLVAVGARVRDDLLEAGVGRPEQYVVVPPGIAAMPIPPRASARLELQVPQGVPVVAYVGRLAGVKRPERFVDVALELGRTYPDARFLIVGGGELLPALRDRARPLGERAMFLGWRPDVENIYAASDVVVLTSDNEGMPVTLIEAAAAGVPAVTTGVGSAPEVVVDGLTGFVTDRTTRGLADAVDRLLADPELRSRMGRAAAARAEREFGADRLAASMQALYEGIIVAGARAGRRQAPRLGRFRRH